MQLGSGGQPVSDLPAFPLSVASRLGYQFLLGRRHFPPLAPVASFVEGAPAHPLPTLQGLLKRPPFTRPPTGASRRVSFPRQGRRNEPIEASGE